MCILTVSLYSDSGDGRCEMLVDTVFSGPVETMDDAVRVSEVLPAIDARPHCVTPPPMLQIMFNIVCWLRTTLEDGVLKEANRDKMASINFDPPPPEMVTSLGTVSSLMKSTNKPEGHAGPSVQESLASLGLDVTQYVPVLPSLDDGDVQVSERGVHDSLLPTVMSCR